MQTNSMVAAQLAAAIATISATVATKSLSFGFMATRLAARVPAYLGAGLIWAGAP